MSDVYAFHKKKINKIFSYNKIKREKNIKGKDNEFFFRFMYHDISLLYNHIKDKKLRSIKFDQNKKKKIF